MAPPTVWFLAVAVVAAALQAAATSPPPSPPTPPAAGRPTSCAPTLYDLYGCVPFLSSGTRIAGPPASCCDPLKAVLGTPAAICLCHTVGSEVNAFLGINIDPIRLALLPVVCFAFVPPQLPIMCLVGPVPPISSVRHPRTPPATPPPRPAHNVTRVAKM